MPFRFLGVHLLVVSLCAAPAAALPPDDPLIDDVAPFKAALLQKFDARQFAELETLELDLRQSKARFAGGDWKVFHFYKVLSAGHVVVHAPIESDWLEVIARLTEWHTQSPKSPVPSLLLADAYAGFAWFARGTGRAPTVSDNAWSLFKDRLNQGAFYLNASRRLSTDNPQWHTTALLIARGLAWPRDRADTLIKEATALEPLYQHAYSMMAIYLVPRWFGEAGDWERFAQETADRIGGTEGSAVYNHIALNIAIMFTSTEFFETNDVRWRKLQWSFADREKLYGTGLQSLNQMLRLAGGARDKTAARAFLKRVGEAWDQSVWTRRQSFDEYKRWVEADQQ